MGKICYRALNRFQVYSFNGDVRLCGWMRDQYLGNLIDNTVEELFNNENALRIRERLSNQDYSMCMADHCPYLANGSIEEMLVEYDPKQRYPEELALGFENTCNYACTGCTFHSKPQGKKREELEENYQIIEDKLRLAMPYAKSVSANGCGELFVSKHILKLLSEWEPIAPIEELHASLETNGSLFDEEHWKQIDNLGKYDLRVSISVMSFREDIYRYLSGTILSVSRIEDNLRFVKSLRESGIINYLELCTVVQEQNFREMPEFASRCIEEYGADSVRLRPYAAWGAEEPDVAWFKNPRNPKHPLYKEYKRVMSDPVFSDPKVDDWSGGQDAKDVSDSPYEMEKKSFGILNFLWQNSDDVIKRLHDLTPNNNGRIVVYGVTDISKAIVQKLISYNEFNVEYMIDRDCTDWYYLDKRIWRHIHLDELDKDVLVLLALFDRGDDISAFLKNKGYNHIVFLRDIVK
ncbi:MAG: radical SAM protein [Lachnospiraceae bacterium]|nr:radical SAM protein [Lachnospiraceae bacterium]